MKPKTILIVDDEPGTRQGLKKMLERWSAGQHLIMTADNGRDALLILEKTPVDLMITDIRMPEMTGLQLTSRLSESGAHHTPSVILLSGYAEFKYAQQAIQLGVVDYLLKPVGKDKLIAAVEQALQAVEERSKVGIMRKIVDERLLETTASGDNLSEPVREALAYIDEHLGEAIGLREAAEHAHLNASYFSVLFKEQLGMTFSEYVARRRLQRAKEMLLTSRLPVADIAERVGYQTAKYFNKVFKEYEGRSPGQYRAEMTGESEQIQ